jgi:hypothetical protein
MALNQGNQGQTGKQVGQNLTASFGEYADTLVTELMPRYYEQAYRGQTYFNSITNAAVTAYSGASGGTPLLGVWNPANSGKNLIIIHAMVSVYTAASAAGTCAFRLYAGVTAAITGTLVSPVSSLTFTSTGGGSVARASQNAANSSSTALTYINTIGSYYWATAAGAVMTNPLLYDCAGSLIIPPGSMIGLGGSVALTSATYDAFILWSEAFI